MASRVYVRNASLVSPNEHNGKSSKLLLPDTAQTIWFIPYRTRILFFKCPIDKLLTFDSILLKLKSSLAEALVEFYPLAGRLIIREDGLMEVLCNGQGVLFIEAIAEVTLEELQTNDSNGHFEGISVDLLQDLAQTDGHLLQWPWSSDAPLFIIQVTKLACGGICMSIKFNHQLLDGAGTWHFVRSWAELSCGKSMSLRPVVTEINKPSQSSCVSAKKKEELQSDYIRYKNSDLVKSFSTSPKTQTTGCEMKCFCFSKEMIIRLKQENPGYSTFQVLTAHIWSKVTAARNLSENDITCLLFAVNCRGRVSWIPTGFVGAAALMPRASTRVGRLATGTGAALLKNKIDDCMERLDEYWEMVGCGDREHTVLPLLVPHRDLNVGESFYFPVFQDFGFGKNEGMTIIPVLEDGKVFYFPTREEGGVAAYISLKSDVLKSVELP